VRFRRPTVCALAACVLAGAETARAALTPWDDLVNDSWITFNPSAPSMTMTPVNTAAPYDVGFDQAASGNKARGMNALKFSYGGANQGHLVTDLLAGSFTVQNTGNSRTFTDLVLVVVIDAPALPDDFALSLNVIGGAPWPFDPDQHFTHYDHPAYDTGRPSGYYSITSPPGEPVAYDFASGMLTVWAAQDVDLGPNGGTVGFDYAFENLPGRAVFSVYGLDETVGWIYHTNRGLQDVNNPSKPVSTFEVLPEPATLALAAAGAALALGRKRWRPGLRP